MIRRSDQIKIKRSRDHCFYKIEFKVKFKEKECVKGLLVEDPSAFGHIYIPKIFSNFGYFIWQVSKSPAQVWQHYFQSLAISVYVGIPEITLSDSICF